MVQYFSHFYIWIQHAYLVRAKCVYDFRNTIFLFDIRKTTPGWYLMGSWCYFTLGVPCSREICQWLSWCFFRICHSWSYSQMVVQWFVILFHTRRTLLARNVFLTFVIWTIRYEFMRNLAQDVCVCVCVCVLVCVPCMSVWERVCVPFSYIHDSIAHRIIWIYLYMRKTKK